MKNIKMDKVEVEKMDEVLKQFPPNIEGIKTAVMLLARYCIEIGKSTNATSINITVDEIYDKETLADMGSVKLEWVLNEKEGENDG